MTNDNQNQISRKKTSALAVAIGAIVAIPATIFFGIGDGLAYLANLKSIQGLTKDIAHRLENYEKILSKQAETPGLWGKSIPWLAAAHVLVPAVIAEVKWIPILTLGFFNPVSLAVFGICEFVKYGAVDPILEALRPAIRKNSALAYADDQYVALKQWVYKRTQPFREWAARHWNNIKPIIQKYYEPVRHFTNPIKAALAKTYNSIKSLFADTSAMPYVVSPDVPPSGNNSGSNSRTSELRHIAIGITQPAAMIGQSKQIAFRKVRRPTGKPSKQIHQPVTLNDIAILNRDGTEAARRYRLLRSNRPKTLTS